MSAPSRKSKNLNKFYKRNEMAKAIEVQKPDRLFGGWLWPQGIAYFDPSRVMRPDREAGGGNFYFPFDQHWNEDGHCSLGRRAADEIKDQVWLRAITGQGVAAAVGSPVAIRPRWGRGRLTSFRLDHIPRGIR